MAKTILYVIGSLDLGGAERHVAIVTPHLKTYGWEPTIFCLSRRGIQADEVEKAGVKVIGPPSPIDNSQTTIGKLARLIASSAKLFVLLVSTRPRIAHFFLPAAYLLAAPLAIIALIPIRVMSRRSLNRYQNNHPVLRRMELLLHPHMHMLLANSKAVLSELLAETAAAKADLPIELIYNGVDLAKSIRSDKAQHRDPAALILIIVANLIPYKGHADLFHALEMIADKLPASWTLLCVGRDDGLGARLIELAADLRLDPHIQFLGSRSDIPELLASADIGILCSHEEGFSNALLESMAAGLPMVVTNVGGNAEAVIDQESGFVVPTSDPAALGAAILTLALNPERRKQMGAAARRRIEEHFSLDRCVRGYDALYRKLDEKRSGRH